ncbi:MAG TPA: SCO family protein [Acidimicrobiales bacterium]|nr:SCO family protein [Acidimicrobiales bacterium]
MSPHETPQNVGSEATELGATKGRRGLGPLFFVALGVAVIVSGTLAIAGIRNRNAQQGLQSLRVSGIPASVSTSQANLMSLSPVPHTMAPNFTLVDQKGRTMSLNSFRGRSVVLEFMDPHCVDICPIVSQEFVDAYHDLGTKASGVVFIAVNVNQYFHSVANMATFSAEHQLNTIPSWHFFTGSVSALKAIWHAYGIVVSAPNPKADIVHTSVVLFIGPDGRERYLGVPSDQRNMQGIAFLPAGQLSSWGTGIALVAQSMKK